MCKREEEEGGTATVVFVLFLCGRGEREKEDAVLFGGTRGRGTAPCARNHG